MAQRLELHERLVSTLGPSIKVYFQPPDNLAIEYPAVVYRRVGIDTDHADNASYIQQRAYECTYIYTDADDANVDALSRLPKTRTERLFVADGLYHAVYNITH